MSKDELKATKEQWTTSHYFYYEVTGLLIETVA
jgi:hypothetical protein